MKNAKKSDPGQRIIEAARTLFLKHGVSDVTTDMLAQAASVSKATMYNRFGNKEEILGAVLDEECKSYFDPDAPTPENFDDFRTAVLDFGINLLRLLDDPEIIRFDQLMHSQILSNPDVVQFYFWRAIEKTYERMVGLIMLGQEKGYIKRTESADLLADMLLNAWRGKNYEKALFGFEDARHENFEERVRVITGVILGI